VVAWADDLNAVALGRCFTLMGLDGHFLVVALGRCFDFRVWVDVSFMMGQGGGFELMVLHGCQVELMV